jgi:hypothetical protein
MKTNIENISVEQIKNDIRNIEIEDSYVYATGSKVLANIVIHAQNGIKKNTLERTKAGRYLMK